MGVGAAIIGSSLIGASSANKAAKAQTAAANADIAFQKETRDLIFDRLDPFYQPGVTAQNALAFELGLGARPMIGGTAPQIEEFTVGGGGAGGFSLGAPTVGDNGFSIQTTAAPSVTRFRVGGQEFDTREAAQAFANQNPTGATAYQGFQATPGFQFQLDQGNNSINALAGARGGLNSGRTLQDLATFNQGLANQEYGNFLNRLTGMAQGGQAAAGAQANAATNTAAGVSNAYGNIGNAQAAGAIGVGNALNSGINNFLSYSQYQRGIGGGGLNVGGGLFGGNSWGA